MAEIRSNMRQFQVTALLGPRQCGKTTLARSMHVQPSNYFDVEDPVDVARLESPRTVLGKLKGPVVIDELQRMPELFPILRVLADRPGRPANFLILGSATPDLVRGASESLAGRTGGGQVSRVKSWAVGAVEEPPYGVPLPSNFGVQRD